MRPGTFWLSFTLILPLAGTAFVEALPQAPVPAFPQASIQTSSGWGGIHRPSLRVLPGGRFEARFASMDDLARVAFGLEHDPNPVQWTQRAEFSIVNPRGVHRDLYAITATAGREWSTKLSGEAVPPELRPMLRRLLEERFALRARIETKRHSVYALRLSEKAHAPGPSLVRSANHCLGPFTNPRPEDADMPLCPFRTDGRGIDLGAVTMADFARILTSLRHFGSRSIVDQTGLDGRYDVHLTGLPEHLLRVVDEDEVQLRARWAISAREEMKRQLGLELHETTLSIPTLIIERAESPRE